MAHHPSLRAKALELRTIENLTIDQIAERLALPRTTIYYWVKGVPIPKTQTQSAARLRASRANSRRAKARRQDAYATGAEEYLDLVKEPTFRDFVCMYIGEGYKRNRNVVALCNSDPRVVALAAKWIRRFARGPVRFSLQYHADQNLRELRGFWSRLLGVSPDDIRLQRRSNSNGLRGRRWRSRYGVLNVATSDTLLRARLQAWIDLTVATWV